MGNVRWDVPRKSRGLQTVYRKAFERRKWIVRDPEASHVYSNSRLCMCIILTFALYGCSPNLFVFTFYIFENDDISTVVNVFEWATVPPPKSESDPIPICDGIVLEDFDAQSNYAHLILYMLLNV